MGGPGSCRPSEIYGASGGFPAFTDPAYANFLEKKILVMTSNAQEDGFVLHVLDISGEPPPPNLNYLAPKYHDPAWQQGNLGRSSASPSTPPATSTSPPPPSTAPTRPPTIKKIDSKTGQISVFATLPNNGPALGNINYDCVSETLYASNHEDGRIYQVDMTGNVVSTYRHSNKTSPWARPTTPASPTASSPRSASACGPSSRTPVASTTASGGRTPAARPRSTSNEIWSVGYSDEKGVPDPATKLEFLLSAPYNGQNYSNPVSDISFAATGWMLISSAP
jgi:hypothetical protein